MGVQMEGGIALWEEKTQVRDYCTPDYFETFTFLLNESSINHYVVSKPFVSEHFKSTWIEYNFAIFLNLNRKSTTGLVSFNVQRSI